MNTKFTNDEWLLIYQQRNQSGLSARKWCDSNQISYDKSRDFRKSDMRWDARFAPGKSNCAMLLSYHMPAWSFVLSHQISFYS